MLLSSYLHSETGEWVNGQMGKWANEKQHTHRIINKNPYWNFTISNACLWTSFLNTSHQPHAIVPLAFKCTLKMSETIYKWSINTVPQRLIRYFKINNCWKTDHLPFLWSSLCRIPITNPERGAGAAHTQKKRERKIRTAKMTTTITSCKSIGIRGRKREEMERYSPYLRL